MTRTAHIAQTSPLTPESVLQMTDRELSTAARVRYVILLLASLLMAVGVVSLWATEPTLPLRTHVAFGLMTVIALAWTTFAARVLTVRRVLYAKHRVVAARMAVAFTGVFVAGALVLAVSTGAAGGYVAAATGAVLFTVAVALLVRSQRTLEQLVARRAELAAADRGRR